jgi:hypothetical protein
MLYCNKCKIEKPESSFYPYRPTRCKDCSKKATNDWNSRNIKKVKQSQKEWRRNNTNKRREYYQKWYAKNGRKRSIHSRESMKRWIHDHPEVHRCHQAVYEAINRGELTRPSKCCICQTAGKIHGHHDDYEKPLTVVWLCPSCHKRVHKNVNLAIPD